MRSYLECASAQCLWHRQSGGAHRSPGHASAVGGLLGRAAAAPSLQQYINADFGFSLSYPAGYLWLASAHWAVKRPAIRAQVFIALWWGLMLVNLVTANWCWGVWHAGFEPLAPPGVNLLIFVCFASLRAGWHLKQRLATSLAVGRDSLVALAIYAVVMMAGVAWFRVARAAEVGEVPVTQRVVNDIQTDGTVRFQRSS